jgi:hypothetical protein
MHYLIIALFLLVLFIAKLIQIACSPGVKQMPGPFLAKFTDLWRLSHAYKGDLFRKYQELQQKYGNYVRIGPNTILISESDVFQQVMGAKGEFPKVDNLMSLT